MGILSFFFCLVSSGGRFVVALVVVVAFFALDPVVYNYPIYLCRPVVLSSSRRKGWRLH